jgi:hypothetical protein
MHDDLVDRVQDERDDENASDVLPTLAHQLSPAALIRQDGPQEGRPGLARVPHPGPKREENGHRRLEDEPEAHRAVRATDKVFKSAYNRISHNRSFQHREVEGA